MGNQNEMPIENIKSVSEETKQQEINKARKELYKTYTGNMGDKDVEEWKKQIKEEKLIHDEHSKRITENELAFPSESFEKNRGKAIVKYSEIAEAIIANIDKDEIVVVDVGSGKQYINRAILDAIIEKNPEKKMEFIGFDQSDKATKKTSFADGEKVIESAYGIGEALPIKNESADVVKFDFTFQGASEEKIKTMLSEAKSILKESGIITVIDHLRQENPSDDIKARIQNEILNKGMSKFGERAKDQKEWENLFKDNGLIVENAKPYREDGEVSNEKPAQYISFVLKKVEQVEEVEQA